MADLSHPHPHIQIPSIHSPPLPPTITTISRQLPTASAASLLKNSYPFSLKSLPSSSFSLLPLPAPSSNPSQAMLNDILRLRKTIPPTPWAALVEYMGRTYPSPSSTTTSSSTSTAATTISSSTSATPNTPLYTPSSLYSMLILHEHSLSLPLTQIQTSTTSASSAPFNERPGRQRMRKTKAKAKARGSGSGRGKVGLSEELVGVGDADDENHDAEEIETNVNPLPLPLPTTATASATPNTAPSQPELDIDIDIHLISAVHEVHDTFWKNVAERVAGRRKDQMNAKIGKEREVDVEMEMEMDAQACERRYAEL
ncbi:hypothetical protein MMC14_003701 [Varicellaria rhodocarpa]|nr:hypothetical protein [Varicellaria rhodocarpa]